MKYFLIKSKFAKTLALGMCFTALSSSIALANGGSQPSVLPSKLPADAIQVDSKHATDTNILPADAPDTPVSNHDMLEEINSEMIQKQKEIDKYLFEDHAKEIDQQDFNVTHTGPFDSYVEIGIAPYNEENAEYIYDIFGKENVKVVEGHQAVTLPAQDTVVVRPAVEPDMKVINAEVEPEVQPISADASEPALEYENQLIRKDNVVRVQVNGEFLQLDVDPFIENDRTLLPLRGVMEQLGADVKWHQEEEMVEVTTEDITIKLVIGEDTAKITRNIDGELKEESIKLEVPAKLAQNRTFIPGRFVTETLGATVDWDNSLRAMIIETEDVSYTAVIENLVKSFGKKLRMVSLLAPEDILSDSMDENYNEFVSPQLLEEWKNDPQNAPGKLTSSPSPDRIEIISTEEVTEGKYEVKGEIIEVGVASNEVLAKRSITLSVENVNGNWLITDSIVGTFEESSSVVYKNTQYGFNFHLPQTWENYTIIEDEWEGTYAEDSKDNETGPMISLRHPEWNTENKRQDIPVLIFTTSQWNLIEEREFNVGAAPVGPKELGHNEEYVFALQARYNYEFLEGYEEVESILENDSLKPIENK